MLTDFFECSKISCLILVRRFAKPTNQNYRLSSCRHSTIQQQSNTIKLCVAHSPHQRSITVFSFNVNIGIESAKYY
jgi:hypothetical protein